MTSIRLPLALVILLAATALVCSQEVPGGDAVPAENAELGSGTEAAEREAPVDSSAPTAGGAPVAADQLSVDQARLADRFQHLEEALGRLAELSAATDPNRARLLREAIAQSRDQDLNVRFESIVKLLEEERLSAAANNQTELRTELDNLLSLLLKADRDRELVSQREQVRRYLKEVARLTRMQKSLRARTEGGDDPRGLTDDQERVANDTGKLGGRIDADNPKENKDGEKPGGDSKNGDKNKEGGDNKDANKKDGKNGGDQNKDGKNKDGKSSDGKSGESSEKSQNGDPSKPGGDPSKPSEGQPSPPSGGAPSESQPSQGQPSQGQPGSPSQGTPGGEQQPSQPQDPTQRAAQRLKAAQQQMEDARKKLDEAKREGAVEKQKEAIAQLDQARFELERVLRQLREEEMERMLTQLAARFRKMLEMQNAVYEGTVRLDHVPAVERDHDEEIEAARLSREESTIAHEADKALVLLHEEGSSVAFPEAIEQMRGDMRQVAERLAQVKADGITQGLEKDIIAALEETIAALDKAIKDLEKKRSSPSPQQGGQPQEPPLVDKLAELKLILSLQLRINRRTQTYATMKPNSPAESAEIDHALLDLAERQQRVRQATADLSQGRND